MPTDQRRAAARRRAWGRGPIILRFEPLEGRALLSNTPLPDLVSADFDTLHNLDWGDTFHAKGDILNQGNAPVTTPFHVDVYASPTAAIGADSVLLGEVTIPAGLQPGEKAPFDQILNLPPAPINKVDASGSVYVGLVIDREGAVPESDKSNNFNMGQGVDTSLVTITPHQPVSLAATSLGVYPDQARWGGTVQVTTQVQNNAPGNAPPTRALVVLTPAGSVPGGPADVTIGNLDVPAIAAYQTATVSRTVDLPTVPPSGLANATKFTLSVVQDGDFLTNALSPHAATRGPGFDMTPLAIAAPQDPGQSLGPKPDLAAVGLKAPTLPITWGQNFQVTATVQNQGKLESGKYQVRFLLVGTDGSLKNSLFLGDATLDSLKAGYRQDVVQTIKLPSHLPDGLALNAGSVGRIAVEVDPENVLDESNKTNNVAVSDVVTLNVIGANSGSRPAATTGATAPAQSTTPTTGGTGTTTPKTAKATNTVSGQIKSRTSVSPKHTFQHNLKVFPHRVSKFFYDTIKKL